MIAKCSCQHCSGNIEFDAEGFEQGTRVECPHCHLETILFLSPPQATSQQPHAKSVKGTILDYTVQNNTGIISGDDGHRYSFQGAQWKETAKFPTKGMRVDFTPQDETATAIYLIQDVHGAETISSKPQRQFQKVSPKKGVLQFQNPENGFIEEVSNAPLWVLLLGCFYFAAKGVWTHAVAGFLAALCTCGISWLVYPFFADQIMRTHYLRKGWMLCSDCKDPTPEELVGKIITVPPKKRIIMWIIILAVLMLIVMVLAARQ
jgi:hypothetical protein